MILLVQSTNEHENLSAVTKDSSEGAFWKSMNVIVRTNFVASVGTVQIVIPSLPETHKFYITLKHLQ
jgi:hypothetical protein